MVMERPGHLRVLDFALDAVASRLGARPDECFFWATHSGAELDLLVVRGSRCWGFEFKRSTTPTVTRSMHVALDTLGLGELVVVHAGERSYRLTPSIRAVPISRLLDEIQPLR